jgi:hypothetical protein
MHLKSNFITTLKQALEINLTTAYLFLFQTPVPNYKDVDLSFTYELVKKNFDFVQMHQTSEYDFMEQIIIPVSKLPRLQLSSKQIQDFIRFAKLLIACAGMP